MILLSPIQEYSFLANFERLRIQHNEDYPLSLQIKFENKTIYTGKVFSDEKGIGVVVDLPGLLEPYIYHKLFGEFTFIFNDKGQLHTYTSLVFYSKVKVDIDAKIFMQNYFLSLGQSVRSILPTHENYVHFFCIEKTEVKIELHYTTGVESKVLQEVAEVNKLITLNVSPSQFEKIGDRLLRYKVIAGNRTAEYAIDWLSPDRGLQFAFTNSFGVQEVFHAKGEHTLEKELTRSNGIFSGLDENYDLKEVHKHKLYTGFMNKALAYYATDFIRSNEVYLIRGGMLNKPIRISDSKIQDSAADSDLRNYEIEFLPAEINHNVLEMREGGRIFDHTFDNTFN